MATAACRCPLGFAVVSGVFFADCARFLCLFRVSVWGGALSCGCRRQWGFQKCRTDNGLPLAPLPSVSDPLPVIAASKQHIHTLAHSVDSLVVPLALSLVCVCIRRCVCCRPPPVASHDAPTVLCVQELQAKARLTQGRVIPPSVASRHAARDLRASRGGLTEQEQRDPRLRRVKSANISAGRSLPRAGAGSGGVGRARAPSARSRRSSASQSLEVGV